MTPHASVAGAERETARQPLEARDLSHSIGRRELVCPTCGYGVVCDRHPERCPMCGGERWEFASWRPFSRER